jgi:hypothetical protein
MFKIDMIHFKRFSPVQRHLLAARELGRETLP